MEFKTSAVPPWKLQTAAGRPVHKNVTDQFFSDGAIAELLLPLAITAMPDASLTTPGWDSTDPYFVNVEGQEFDRMTDDAPIPFMIIGTATIPGDPWSGRQPQTVPVGVYVAQLASLWRPGYTRLTLQFTPSTVQLIWA